RAIAIVWIEPVVAGLQTHGGGDQNRFMTSAADLKEDAILTLHLNLFVVELPRQVHRAKDLQHQFAAKFGMLNFAWLRSLRSLGFTHRHEFRNRGWSRLWFRFRYGAARERAFGERFTFLY